MKIISWNVNGLASCIRKGFLHFVGEAKPDIVCCQEIKTQKQVKTPGYLQYWNPAKRTGYAGTLVLTRREPLSVQLGFGDEELDDEGRFICLEFEDFFLCNIYAPNLNPRSSPERPGYRARWDAALLSFVSALKKPVILCGDFNVVRADIDTYYKNVRQQEDNYLFREELRESFEKLIIGAGLVDVVRAFYPAKPDIFTWWGPKNQDRAKNQGSRLDYFLVTGELLSYVTSTRHYTDILGSDHCPISLMVKPLSGRRKISKEDKAVLWRSIDWGEMERSLERMQYELAEAAFYQNWNSVRQNQQRIVNSWAAKTLAVRAVSNTNSEPGIDGVRWKDDAEKAGAALSLKSSGYKPMPNRSTTIREKGKDRIIHVPTYRDRAMITLYAYALSPVAETMADKKSFSARKGRSLLDAHAYLKEALSGPNAPEWVALADVEAYYESILHEALLDIIPMDKSMLRKFLKAGVVRNGELFATDMGISLGTSLSPILGNMVLDGLQSYIYGRFYPKGAADYDNGNMVRFADDIAIAVKSEEQGYAALQVVEEFLGRRGLRLNQDKSRVVSVWDGFDFLARHYKRVNGRIKVTPSKSSIIKMERELEELILGWNGTIRALIGKVNDKLSGWGGYHRVEDAYDEFRHIDVLVESLLIKRMCAHHPRWHKKTILDRYWVKEGNIFVFTLPNDPSIRVIRLASIPIVQHKPVVLRFNPYLDKDYFAWLQHRRDILKFNSKYRAIWTRQSGRCAYCGDPMLADQEVEVVEKEIGKGRSPKNLLYIHRQCAYDAYRGTRDNEEVQIDLISLLSELAEVTDAKQEESPYLELTEYFRLCDRSPLTLTFKQIEEILGDRLDWEAYFYEAFWYDDLPGATSPLWKEEGFPFQVFLPSTPDYCIAESWISQGYKIKALHMEKQKVVFRKVIRDMSGLTLPRELTSKKLPNKAVYELNQFFQHIISKYNL